MLSGVYELPHGNIYIYILINHAKDVMCIASEIKSGGLNVTSNKNCLVYATYSYLSMYNLIT